MVGCNRNQIVLGNIQEMFSLTSINKTDNSKYSNIHQRQRVFFSIPHPIMLLRVFENILYRYRSTPENLFKTGHRFLCLMDEKKASEKS